MWVIYSLSPNTVNVLADLIGMGVTAISVFVVQWFYPYLVHDSIRNGRPIEVEQLTKPPELLDLIKQMGNVGVRNFATTRPSLWILCGLPLIFVVIAFAHTGADIFLDFESVRVGSEETFFLSSDALEDGVPLYGLLGETFSSSDTLPGMHGANLLLDADSIARGFSRFSFFPPGPIPPRESQQKLNGLLNYYSSYMFNAARKDGPSSMPTRPDVRCIPYPIPNQTDFIRDNYNTFETISYGYETSSNATSIPNSTTLGAYLNLSECQYETVVKDENAPNESGNWTVLSWSQYMGGSNYDGTIGGDHPFGVRDAGYLRSYITLTNNETDLAVQRQGRVDQSNMGYYYTLDLNETSLLRKTERKVGWGHGRFLRDGLTFAIGITADPNATHWNYHVLEGGVEFQVEYSVLSGPDDTFYTISSWSHQCPHVRKGKDEVMFLDTTKLAGNGVEVPVGCIIDVVIACDRLFDQDNKNATAHVEGSPVCGLVLLSSTLLVGDIEVDRGMLAAYAGIATRNQGLNNIQTWGPTASGFAMNSLAAAYIMTRKTVPGAMPVYDVRATLGVEFVVLLFLPLLAVIPLLLFYRKGHAEPIPRSNLDLLVLGRREEQLQLGASPTMHLFFGISEINANDAHEYHVGKQEVFPEASRRLSQRPSVFPLRKVRSVADEDQKDQDVKDEEQGDQKVGKVRSDSDSDQEDKDVKDEEQGDQKVEKVRSVANEDQKIKDDQEEDLVLI